VSGRHESARKKSLASFNRMKWWKRGQSKMRLSPLLFQWDNSRNKDFPRGVALSVDCRRKTAPDPFPENDGSHNLQVGPLSSIGYRGIRRQLAVDEDWARWGPLVGVINGSPWGQIVPESGPFSRMGYSGVTVRVRV
jgi:hypothetical protein